MKFNFAPARTQRHDFGPRSSGGWQTCRRCRIRRLLMPQTSYHRRTDYAYAPPRTRLGLSRFGGGVPRCLAPKGGAR